MDRINYPQATDELVPGTWKWYKVPEGRSLLFMCPKGHIGSLEDHNIGEDGDVQPSVVCPHENCDFHQWITLSGYQSG